MWGEKRKGFTKASGVHTYIETFAPELPTPKMVSDLGAKLQKCTAAPSLRGIKYKICAI